MVVTDADWASLTGRQSRSFEMRTGCHDDRYGQVRRWYPLEHGAVGDFELSVADGVAEAMAGAADEGTTKNQPRRDAPVGTASAVRRWRAERNWSPPR